MISETTVRPQGDPLLQEKWRGDPCGEGRVPQLGLLRRKHNLPHQVGKPAQSPILICQVRLSNIKNKEVQTFGGLVIGSPPVARNPAQVQLDIYLSQDLCCRGVGITGLTRSLWMGAVMSVLGANPTLLGARKQYLASSMLRVILVCTSIKLDSA